MTDSVMIFDEPDLEFRYGQRLKDPRDGLALFGPHDTDLPSHPASLSHMLIGAPEGIAKFNIWSSMMNCAATNAPKNKVRLWPPFPGFEAAYSASWPTQPVVTATIERDSLLEASRLRDPYQRAHKVVEYYLDGLLKVQKRDEKIGVAVCVVPDEVWANCRPQSVVAHAIGDRISAQELSKRKSGQIGLFDANKDTYLLSPDFRRQLKARAMELDQPLPLQIIRESTLRYSDEKHFGERQLTPLSDRLWNICTTLYYKCGGKPWRLVTAREGVCYIGLAFRRSDDKSTACCAAQMFLDTGDGVVFLGQFGPWYSSHDKQFHLNRNSAYNLLHGILKTYEEMGGKQLTEIFLHSRSTIDDEEFAGYEAACPSGVKLVGIRVRPDKDVPRLYRMGEMPVLRGTFWRLSNRSGLLWGAGFKARIGTYDGWETPLAMRIDIQHGEAAIERVAQDIFGLTKLNYNACRLGDSDPVTVGFSDAVGEILISNPTVTSRRPQFRYYI
jgi:hypothetical protein